MELRAEPVPGYPTGLWQAGDVWRGQFNLLTPAHLPPGRYHVVVQPQSSGGTPLDPFATERVIVQ
jgi:hypothetical protein